jgi:DNA-binding NarL/FixJ family response regulator
MYRPIHVLIVDDDPLFRQGIRFSLQEQDDVTVAGDVSTSADALAVIAATPPDVLLVDLNLRAMDGLDLTRTVRKMYPGLGVIVLAQHESDAQAFDALRAGAAAYYSKAIGAAPLAQTIQRVARGEYVINDVMFAEPKVAQRILTQFRDLHRDVVTEAEVDFSLFSPLSEREIRVLEQIAGGSANKEIADALGISTQTVKNHISSILRKLSLNDRTQAVIYALQRGWIATPVPTAQRLRVRAAVVERAEDGT